MNSNLMANHLENGNTGIKIIMYNYYYVYIIIIMYNNFFSKCKLRSNLELNRIIKLVYTFTIDSM